MNLRFEILKAVAASPGAPINEIADAISYDRQKTAWSVRDCAQDGLLAKRLGRVPIPGAGVDLDGWRLTAEQGAGRRNRIGTVLAQRIVGEDDGD